VSVQQVDADKATYLGAPAAKGAYVSIVEKDSPADKAGLKVDDLILAVDGKKITGSEDLVTEVSSRRPGDRVTLTIWRDRREIEAPVTLAERTNGQVEAESKKESPGEEPGPSHLGFTVTPPSPALRERLQELTPPLKGVMIKDVDPDSNVARKGLVEGMILLNLNGQPTPSVDAYRRAAESVKPGDVVRLRVFDPRFGEEVSYFFRAPARK
jgi:serine protease Do